MISDNSLLKKPFTYLTNLAFSVETATVNTIFMEDWCVFKPLEQKIC